MDELDDLAAFGLAEVDADRAAGEYDDPHAPEVGAVLTTELAVELAHYWLDDTAPPEWWPRGEPVTFRASKAMSAWVLAVAPVVEAAEAQADAAVADAIAGRDGDTRHPEYDAWLATTDATEAAVRAMRAGGDV